MVKVGSGLMEFLPFGKNPPLFYGEFVSVAKVQPIFTAKESARLNAVENDDEVLQRFDLIVLIE